MSKRKTNSVSTVLQEAMDEEVREIRRKYQRGDTIPAGKKEGDFVYDTLERMRILDRALKLESLRLKQDDPGFGSGFEK